MSKSYSLIIISSILGVTEYQSMGKGHSNISRSERIAVFINFLNNFKNTHACGNLSKMPLILSLSAMSNLKTLMFTYSKKPKAHGKIASDCSLYLLVIK